MSVKGEKMKSRLLNQFQVSTRLKQLLDVINARFDDGDALLEYLLYYRFLDTASGVWLDIIGDIVGIPRPYDEVDTGIFTYRALADPNDSTLGYTDIAGSTDGGQYQSLDGILLGDKIDDTEYRGLIKAKIFSTKVKPNIQNIYLFIKNTFGIESTVTDDNPGEIEVEIASTLTAFQRRVLTKYAPVASGYSITITNWP